MIEIFLLAAGWYVIYDGEHFMHLSPLNSSNDCEETDREKYWLYTETIFNIKCYTKSRLIFFLIAQFHKFASGALQPVQEAAAFVFTLNVEIFPEAPLKEKQTL